MSATKEQFDSECLRDGGDREGWSVWSECDTDHPVYRIRVPGGWIYRIFNTIRVFESQGREKETREGYSFLFVPYGGIEESYNPTLDAKGG